MRGGKEKRQILEDARKEELNNWRDDVRPNVYGKFNEKNNAGGEWSVPRGQWLLPASGELSPALIARAIAKRLDKADLPAQVRARIAARIAIIDAKDRETPTPTVTHRRKPWFCSGCPPNPSPNLPAGHRTRASPDCRPEERRVGETR